MGKSFVQKYNDRTSIPAAYICFDLNKMHAKISN